MAVVDVRSYPGSRRHPDLARQPLAAALADAGIAYRWEPRLGGFRRGRPDSPNVALRHPSFRAYADHMTTSEFLDALDEVLAERLERAGPPPSGLLALLCAETLWWRCHRRLIADAALLLRGVDVVHLMPNGTFAHHALTPGARRDGSGFLVYDGRDASPGPQRRP